MSQDILDEINSLIKKYFDDQKEEEFIPGKTKIPLAIPQFGSDGVGSGRYSVVDSEIWGSLDSWTTEVFDISTLIILEIFSVCPT